MTVAKIVAIALLAIALAGGAVCALIIVGAKASDPAELLLVVVALGIAGLHLLRKPN